MGWGNLRIAKFCECECVQYVLHSRFIQSPKVWCFFTTVHFRFIQGLKVCCFFTTVSDWLISLVIFLILNYNH